MGKYDQMRRVIEMKNGSGNGIFCKQTEENLRCCERGCGVGHSQKQRDIERGY